MKACGKFSCPGCSGCDSEHSPPGVEENDLERAQRIKREEDALRAKGKPTLKVSFGDLLKKSGKLL